MNAVISGWLADKMQANMSQGCRKQLWIGQANVSGWAECLMATKLKIVDFKFLIIFSEILVRQLNDMAGGTAQTSQAMA